MPSSDDQAGSEIGNQPQAGENLAAITNNPSFVADILLAEYKALRDEIIKKMDHRTAMVVCSVTVSSAVLGFGIERQSGSLLLVSPLVSLLLGILILFHNVQIGETSEYLRNRFEVPIASRYREFVGWHKTKDSPKYRWMQRTLPYHLPLVLIAIAPAIVATPLALSNLDSLTLTIPVMVVDALLLMIYIAQIIKHRDSL